MDAGNRAWHAEGLVKPVVIHCRRAVPQLLPVLRASGLGARGRNTPTLCASFDGHAHTMHHIAAMNANLVGKVVVVRQESARA